MPLHHTPSLTIPKNADTADVGYFFISDCSDAWVSIDDDVSRLCSNEPNASDPLTFTPVQELTSESPILRIYRNIFCAICNYRAIEELQAWNIEVLAVSVQLMSPIVYNVIPPTRKTAPRTCLLRNLEYASSCSYHHSDIANGCSKYYSPWFISGSQFTESKWFKNIFCAVCKDEYPRYEQFDKRLNLPVIIVDTYRQCSSSWLDITLTGVWPASHPAYVPDLLTLFNFGDDGMQQCEPGEIYDYFSQSCRLVSCPNGFVLSDGMCEIVPVTEPPLHSQVAIPIITPDVDQDLESCVSSAFLNGSFEMDDTCSLFKTEITLNMLNSDAVVVHVNSTSFLSSLKSLNNILVSWQNNSAGEKLCNASSFLLLVEDDYAKDNNNLTDTTCVQSEQLVGRVSRESLNFTNTDRFARIIKYSWNDREDCYQMTVTWTDCDASKQPANPCVEVELAPDEFQITLTGNSTTVLHKASGKTLMDDEFSIGENGTVRVCVSVFYSNPEKITRLEQVLPYVSFGCLILSLVATFLTFLSYCLLRELRNLTGYIVINLLIAFFVAQLMFLLAPRLLTPTELCLTSAIISQFFWLAGFFWMNTLSFVTTNTLSRDTVVRDKSLEMCRLIRYMAYAWGAPLLILSVCISVHFCDCTGIAPIYGKKDGTICWLIGHDGYAILWGFTAPVFALLLCNVVLFFYAVATIRKKMASAKSKITSKRMKMEIGIYMKVRKHNSRYNIEIVTLSVRASPPNSSCTHLASSRGTNTAIVTWPIKQRTISNSQKSYLARIISFYSRIWLHYQVLEP